MPIQTRLVMALLVPLLCAAAALSQEESKPPGSDKIYLDVVVTPKSGPPVTGLQQQDFTILDNKAPRPIISFRAVSAIRCRAAHSCPKFAGRFQKLASKGHR